MAELRMTLSLLEVYRNIQRRQWHPTPVLLPGKSRGRRSLVGCRLWGRTESDTTEATQQQRQEQHRNIMTRPIQTKESRTKKLEQPTSPLPNLAINYRDYPAIPLLGTQPENTIIQKRTCALLSTAALFSIARTQKHLNVHQQMRSLK